MKIIVGIILMSGLLTQCSLDRTIQNLNQSEIEALKAFESLDDIHQVQISESSEAGQKLWLCLNFVSKSDKNPLNNQKIKLYHTSSEGEYEPSDPNDESTARLNGTVITNTSGQIFVKTILPGDYGESKNNRHIHTTVFDARPEAYDIFFTQYSGGMGKMMNSGNDQLFYADLKQTADSTLVAFLTMEVKNPKSQIK